MTIVTCTIIEKEGKILIALRDNLWGQVQTTLKLRLAGLPSDLFHILVGKVL